MIIIRGKEEEERERKKDRHKGNGLNEDKATHLTHLESADCKALTPICLGASESESPHGFICRECSINLRCSYESYQDLPTFPVIPWRLAAGVLGGGSSRGWRWEGEEWGGWGVEGVTGFRWECGIKTGIYFKCIYKNENEGKKPSVFLFGSCEEPLAKIII